jgi:hypothetical protein
MRSPLVLSLCLALCSTPSLAAAQPAAGTTLPLERVRLYETGVGYFERTGVIDGRRGDVSLPVPAGHLDDALKTVVVLSGEGDARVTGIEFRSSASRPLALALAGLPAGDAEERMTHDELLGSLRGAAVELRTRGGSHNGRLIDVVTPDASTVEQCSAAAKEAARPSRDRDGSLASVLARCERTGASTLLLLTTGGAIRRFSADQIDSVRPTDPAFRARLGTALDALGQRGSQTRRQLRLQATPGKKVTLGYVAESPIWRSTYRLVLGGDSEQATLQGWALLHNDTDEDWQKVRVELCNGRPDSFLFPLAAPRYARRELVTPERELSTVPQLLDTTVDNMWVGESYGAGGLGLTGVGEGGGGRGEGIGLGRIGTIGHGIRGGGASSLLAVGNLAAVQEAEGVEAGALFRYALPSPVDLRAHGSALMPFLSRPVRAHRIALFKTPGATARSAIHLQNDTGQTLPPGTMALFADGGFAGESALSRTKPSESRIVSFGFDLDVELEQQSARHSDQSRLLVAGTKTLTEHYVRRHQISHQIVNRSAAARTVYLHLRFVHNSQITGADRTAFDSEQNAAYAVFEVEPKTRKNRDVSVTEGLQRSHVIEELTLAQLARLADQTSLPNRQRGILRDAAGLLRRSAQHLRHRAATIRSVAELEEEMDRLRTNIRTLGPRSEAAAPFVKRLLAAERRASSLRRKARDSKKQAVQAKATAHARLRKLAPTSAPAG